MQIVQVKSYIVFEQYTSDKKLPIVKALMNRREELRQQVKALRDPQEIARVQGQMTEVDLLIEHLSKTA